MINVIWYNACRGNWDSGLLCNIFEAYPGIFEQYNDKELLYTDRAIVIVVGCPEIPPLRKYLETIKSGIVILTSEEDSFFNWQAAIPQHLNVWTQYYSPNKSAIKERLLLGAPNRMAGYALNKNQERKYLWSFIGQVQNPFRHACYQALRDLPDGYLHMAGAFGGMKDGIEYDKYLDIMCQSKFVLCPAGSMCVDSFRVYEAMECGAIPIVDTRAPRDPEDFNYWKEVYPEAKLLTVTNWNDFDNAALDMLRNIQWHSDWWPEYWWPEYKKQLTLKLISIASR